MILRLVHLAVAVGVSSSLMLIVACSSSSATGAGAIGDSGIVKSTDPVNCQDADDSSVNASCTVKRSTCPDGHDYLLSCDNTSNTCTCTLDGVKGTSGVASCDITGANKLCGWNLRVDDGSGNSDQ